MGSFLWRSGQQQQKQALAAEHHAAQQQQQKASPGPQSAAVGRLEGRQLRRSPLSTWTFFLQQQRDTPHHRGQAAAVA